MDIYKILSTKTQDEILALLKHEINNCIKLKQSMEKAEKSESMTLFDKRKTANAWSYSEQFDKSKTFIKQLTKHLI